MKRLLPVLLVGLIMGADDKKELDQLKGTWTITAFEVGGEGPPEMKGTFTFDGQKLRVKLNEMDHEATFKIDPGKKPKEIDVTPGDGPEAGKVLPGIYSISKDELKISLSHEGKERPKSLEGKPEEGNFIMTLKRDK